MKILNGYFFDVGSTIVDEHAAYEHRMREIADLANMNYGKVYEMAMEFYKENKKGDLETAKLLGVELTKWHKEDERLYRDASKCLEILSSRYKKNRNNCKSIAGDKKAIGTTWDFAVYRLSCCFCRRRRCKTG